MIHGDGALRHSSKGRPSIDDWEQILGYFARQLAKGRTVAEIARRGLIICEYRPCPDGKHELTAFRKLQGPTLERRYRELRKELDDAMDWLTAAPPLANAGYIGVSAPRAPLSYGEKPRLKRGRPRKKPTR